MASNFLAVAIIYFLGEGGERMKIIPVKEEEVLKLKKFTDDEFLQLYQQGLSDPEIARRLGVHRMTVWYRRKKLGLPANKPKLWKSKTMRDKFIELWLKGASYKEIRKILGISHRTITMWRRKLGLPPRLRFEIREHGYNKLLKDFLNSGERFAEVVDFKAKPRTVYGSLYRIARRKGYPVKVHLRRGRVFLERI